MDLRAFARAALGVQPAKREDDDRQAVQEALDLSPVLPVAQFGNRATVLTAVSQVPAGARPRHAGGAELGDGNGAFQSGFVPLDAFFRFTGPAPNSTTAEIASPVPYDSTLSRIAGYLTNAIGGTGSITLTVYKNGVATGLTMTWTAAQTGAKSTDATVSLVAGDRVELRIEIGGAGGNTTPKVGWAVQ